MAKKMLLVDPKVMEQLKQQSAPPPPPAPAPPPPPPSASSLCPRPMPDVLTDTLVDLDQEMKDVLQQPGVSAHDKASAYQQILHRYLTLGDQYQERSGMPPRPSSPPLMTLSPPPAPPPSPSPPQPSPASSPSSQPWEHWKETAVESVPQRFQKKAKQLLKHVERIKDLSWTPAGEMVYRGQKIPRSNIVDLVGDMMRHRRSVPDPAGWKVFASALKRSNVPLEFIGHQGRRRWVSKARTTPVGDRSFLSSTLSSTSSSLSSPSSQAIGGGEGGEEEEDDSTPRTLVTSVLDSSEIQSPTLISGSWMRY